jgi:hypothetical protein
VKVVVGRMESAKKEKMSGKMEEREAGNRSNSKRKK